MGSRCLHSKDLATERLQSPVILFSIQFKYLSILKIAVNPLPSEKEFTLVCFGN